jgi:hypothetical protein
LSTKVSILVGAGAARRPLFEAVFFEAAGDGRQVFSGRPHFFGYRRGVHFSSQSFLRLLVTVDKFSVADLIFSGAGAASTFQGSLF